MPCRLRAPATHASILLLALPARSFRSRTRPTPLSEATAEVNEPEGLAARPGIQFSFSAIDRNGFVGGLQKPAIYVGFSISAVGLDGFAGDTQRKEPRKPLGRSPFREDSGAPTRWTLGSSESLRCCDGVGEPNSQGSIVGAAGPSACSFHGPACITVGAGCQAGGRLGTRMSPGKPPRPSADPAGRTGPIWAILAIISTGG